MAELDVTSPSGAPGTIPPPRASVPRAPTLENGDRLTRCEFERRYALRPDLKKAQLIEGIVYMPSPVRFATHGEPHAAILGVLLHYSAFTPGVSVGDNATVRLDLDNEPQPDALLRIEPETGGRSRLSDDDYVEGAPELIVEIAASSASIDLHDKLRAYRRNGVQEYVVWRTQERRIDWFELADGDYRPLPADDTRRRAQPRVPRPAARRPRAPERRPRRGPPGAAGGPRRRRTPPVSPPGCPSRPESSAATPPPDTRSSRNAVRRGSRSSRKPFVEEAVRRTRQPMDRVLARRAPVAINPPGAR